MTKWVCSVCGYVYEGEKAPEACPVCKAPADKFVKQDGEMSWAAEHVVGVAQGSSEDIMADLRANFQGECSEVGMYLAMARVAQDFSYDAWRYCVPAGNCGFDRPDSKLCGIRDSDTAVSEWSNFFFLCDCGTLHGSRYRACSIVQSESG